MSVRLSKPVLRVVGPEAVREAASALRAGGLVVFPTDTVYGLGVDPWNEEAVQRLFRVKGRAASKPLQLLLADAAQLQDVVAEVSDAAQRIARRFFPGGLTLVLKRRPAVPATVVAGGATVGVRVPDHTVCLEMIRAFGSPLAASSANRSGRESPSTAQEAVAQVGESVDLVLDAGPCPLGRESAVLDLSGSRPRLLREGAIPKVELEEALGAVIDE